MGVVCFASMGLPHSGHSGGVSGRVSSSIVVSTSTNGTSAMMPRKRSGAILATAPISMPPALPPWATMRPREVKPSRARYSAAAMKSVKVFVFFSRLPSLYQR